jgi:hypothetical protein
MKKDLKYFINRFGLEEGSKRFELSKENRKNSVWCIEHYLNKGLSEEEAKKKISQLQKRDKNHFIKKYGEVEGNLRYKNFIKNFRASLNNFIKKYGPKQGKIKYQQWIKSTSQTLENCIRRYGIEEGTKKYNQFRINISNGQNNRPEAEKQASNKKKAQNLENFIKRYGEIEGPIKFEKYMSSYKLGTSKVSQKFFWKLYEALKLKIKLSEKDVYFAELNKEYFIYEKEIKKIYFLDFVYKKKCIEYNGDKWHGNPIIYKESDCPTPFGIRRTCKQIWEYDKFKSDLIKKHGFELFIIWEKDLKINEKEMLKKCIDFLIK